MASLSKNVRADLNAILARSGLPNKLVDRLLVDCDGAGGTQYRRVADVNSLAARPPNSTYWGINCACWSCNIGFMVPAGQLGRLKYHSEFTFLAPGYHSVSKCGEEFEGVVTTNSMDRATVYGSAGFVIISEGHIGVLLVESCYRLLAPGVYEWNSPSVVFISSVDVTGAVASLGPYALITVPEGLVSVTYCNGELRVLGWEEEQQPCPSFIKEPSTASPFNPLNKPSAAAAAAAAAGSDGVVKRVRVESVGAAAAASSPATSSPSVKNMQQTGSRTYFLDDPKWVHSTFLSLKEQTDKLEGNDLLSRDNVEILMVAMSSWRIADPVLAIRYAAEDMEKIRSKVNMLVRATIARIVSSTTVGAGAAGSGAAAHDHSQHEHHEDADLSHLMQSDVATLHMKELSKLVTAMGVVVSQIYIPERFFKNDDLRQEISRQAVIGIKAEADRAAADARAYATIANARAEAQAIAEVAKAHADAGKMLGAPGDTAARLALSDVTAKALSGAQVTIFSGAPEQMPFMLTGSVSNQRSAQQ